MGISYSVDADPDSTAKAMLRERHISLKHSKALAREVKGKTAGEAVEYLEAVQAVFPLTSRARALLCFRLM